MKPTVLLTLLLVAACSTTQPTAVDGEQMEREFWGAMKDGNMPEIEAKIAPGFQSVHQDGSRDRAAEIALIKGLKLGDYTLDNFKVSKDGQTIVVTYTVSVTETIDGKVLPTKPAMRISVWTWTQKGWQWIAHANLNPMTKGR